MSSKINIICIISDHIDTLVDEGSGSVSKTDYITFFAVPLACGIGGYFLSVPIDKDIAAGAISALSIFAGLLINVLVLIYTIKSGNSHDEKTAIEVKFLRQIFANLSFAILIAVATTIVLVLIPAAQSFAKILTSVAVAFSANFVLTLLMALKRLHLLLRERF